MEINFVKGKEVILSNSWPFLNGNNGQSMAMESCRRFVGKESCVVKLNNMCGQANIEMNLFKFFKK